jgi:CBS domain-containing protein
MIVKQILAQKGSTKVETISPRATISDAAQVLSKKRIGALIVSETGSDVAGIVSERDVVRELGAVGVDCLPKPLESIMTSKVISCTPADKAVKILETMTNGRFRHMPVFEDGKLAGVISIGDVVKARIAEIEMENTALADMIRGA